MSLTWVVRPSFLAAAVSLQFCFVQRRRLKDDIEPFTDWDSFRHLTQ